MLKARGHSTKIGEVRHQPTLNHHTGGLSTSAKSKIASLKLSRVAGNIYECPSTKDFWKVKDSGAIVRLSSSEVDNGERLSLPVGSNSFQNDVCDLLGL